MITVLIRASRGPEALAVTLSALVPAVAAGLVGDAVVLAANQDDTIAKVVDAAGATLIDGSWAQGARTARRDWLLCLEDGDIPQEGWIQALERFAAFGKPEQRGRFKRRRRPVEAALQFVLGLFGRDATRAGELVHKRVLLGEVKARPTISLAAFIERDPFFV
ncbi:glycosyltransferase family 2 protein [Microvirga terricola]|uniref:Glycosyl transferase family 2 n=1 Tax=Microvirga terricola TaxID=2719797 RepID=A0ABX0VA47_9HYPH|nr:hypothetical protein [Microvirga terricola]NIX76727.1 hypothetical protein [Microvirga terricola]